MKLAAKVKLQPTEQQFDFLLNTLKLANQACNDISKRAWDSKTFRQFDIHRLTYRDIRTRYNLSAQVVVRAIAKVTDAYKLDKKACRKFSLLGGFAYDNRILSWKLDKQTVSIWTIAGRQHIPFLAGKRQLELLNSQRGESDLCFINGDFYLFTTCDIDEPTPNDIGDILGVDLGIVNIATDSDGNQYSGSQVLSLRKRRRGQRKRMQAKGTQSAKRRLKKLSGREKRFSNHVNHVISKQIVNLAKDTGRGIALEDLSNIRERVTVRRKQRNDLHSWAFDDLRQKVEYKSRLAGVPLVLVDPRNTSRLCPECGCIDKRNRKTQSSFLCVSCGYAANSDTNAAFNISVKGWAAINQPNVGDPLPVV